MEYVLYKKGGSYKGIKYLYNDYMTLNAVKEKISEVRDETNIKDANLRRKLDLLLSNTCIQKLDKDNYVFFKYFASNKKGILYQLLLSGDSDDAIYEFGVFGHDVKFIQKLRQPLRIETKSNYDLAEFDVKDITTTVMKENDIQFKQDLKEVLRNVSVFDIINVHVNDKVIVINNNLIGEVKSKYQIRDILRKKYDGITKIEFIEKKKKHYISAFDLGRDEFKRQLIELNLVTEDEYNLYTKFNDKLYNEYKGKFREVEVIF